MINVLWWSHKIWESMAEVDYGTLYIRQWACLSLYWCDNVDVSCGFGYWELGAAAQASFLATGASEHCKFTTSARLHGNFWNCPEPFVWAWGCFPGLVCGTWHVPGAEHASSHKRKKHSSFSVVKREASRFLQFDFFSCPESALKQVWKNIQEQEVSSWISWWWLWFIRL